ncbi:MAG: flagellar motor protein MotB [Thermodesulfobacteriota bacterium]
MNQTGATENGGRPNPAPVDGTASPSHGSPGETERHNGAGFGQISDGVSWGVFNEEVHPGDRVFQLFRAPRSTHWSVVWSDLMMTMFLLFVVLYVYQLADRKFTLVDEPGAWEGTGSGIATSGPSPFAGSRPSEEVYDLSRRVIAEADIEDFAAIDLAPDKTVRIVITGDLLFDPGDDRIRPSALEKLARIADLLRSSPYVINVIGHTDSVPIHTPRFASNWELSVLRATAVIRHLTAFEDLPAARFFASGHSYFQPVAGNDSPANRARNRRVEIVITRDMPGGGQ